MRQNSPVLPIPLKVSALVAHFKYEKRSTEERLAMKLELENSMHTIIREQFANRERVIFFEA